MSQAAAQMTVRESRHAQLVEGEFTFTAEDFRMIAETLHAAAGIALPESKATLVYSRLAKRLRTLGLESFRDYCALVSGKDGLDERQQMIVALTTNVTRFFREPHHFEHLKAQVLPGLLADVRRGGSLRIWSAGSSNGQEAYSIALTILSLMPDAPDADIRILASDIDTKMLAEGRAGLYGATAMAPVPTDLRTRWFEREGDAWRASEPLKRLVVFNELNLIGDWPMKRQFQAIFCRNVLIYFEEATQAKIFSRFVPLMAPGARLYIGHSERVCGPDTARFATDGVTTYRLTGAGR
ncbi:protein-glutamate O-methyltransferase CheR [Phenylobacterium sp. J367]|uniref:CheR family methyltransferase n=1 Tax=Phenylobacterium sp. J367 TaxID=2898435 RepID=UPI00215094D9|nr:protein-glutamate O-methyltransferase [Phenylobacterium sp. J367]MCR5877632.1 protein-glutamate O-methyltransferase [Phenylobacterium sp. J367]